MSDPQATPGFVAPEPSDLAPLFPGYEIQNLIATGGMGAVYRVIQKSLDRTVALKILPMEFSQDAAFCAGFEAEAKAMARLNHPNLIGVYDFGEVNGMLYIIMEYVPGESLYHASYGKMIDPAEVVRLVSGVCDGLAHAHEHGIIHRDIKPSNILLDLNAYPKIGDFGLARPTERKMEEGEEIFGTPHYTAPEVVNAPHSVDHRADIFSVGVLLFELLTAQLPDPDPRPASTLVRCDPRFDTIIRRATQVLPAARYSSAAEMAMDLRAIGSSLAKAIPAASAVPRRAAPTPRYATSRKQASNNTTPIVLVVLAAAGIAGFLIFSKSPPPKPVASDKPVVPNATPHPGPPKNTSNGVGTTVPKGNPIPDPTVPDPAHSGAADPDPAVVVNPGVDPKPQDSGISPDSLIPKFDVPGFLSRAKDIMVDKTKVPNALYQTNLNGNLADLKRDLGKGIKRMKFGSAEMDRALQTEAARLEKAGSRLPNTLPSELAAIPGSEELHASYLQREKAIDDSYHQSLAPYAETYVVGIEKQIERLMADNDPAAVEMLKKEIAKTRSNSKHFLNLITGKTLPENE